MILLLLGGFAVLQGLNQENQSGTRFLTLERGKRLADLVRDTDRELVIEDHLTIADKAPPNEGYSLAHWKTVFSDVVLVVRVSQVQSALTLEQDWITTTVRATAQEVLKNSTAAELRQGTQLKFKLDGGEILLGRTRVHAHSKLAKPFRQGKAYLIFASVGPNDELWAYVDESYELADGKLLRQLVREPSDEITEQDLGSVLYEIRRTALDRRPGVSIR
jgi:hypothetical protein